MKRRLIRLALALGAPGVALGLVLVITAPALANGPFNIWLENGNQAMSSNCTTSGCLVTNSSHPGRQLTWSPLSGNYRGDSIGYWTWANTNYVAAQDNCGGLTTKTNTGSNGVVWAQHFQNGHLYYVNRYCDQNISGLYVVMASDNVGGHQWKMCLLNSSAPNDCSGWYTKLTLNPA